MDSKKGYNMNFNQDFTSISAVNAENGIRLFSISTSGNIDEIYVKEDDNIKLVERFFSSSLVVLVTVEKPNCLKMLHFKKRQDICNCVYPSDILAVRMSRDRMVVCLAESIHVQDIRDMEIIHSIENIAPNHLGLCAFSVNSQLAFPICSTTGELRIFDALNLKNGPTIRAHNTALSALGFNSNGTMLTTASERGTVIRIFCTRTGQRLQEFRRGVKRCVRIASLVFFENFVCASSNKETVHIFKIDVKVLEDYGHEQNETGNDAVRKQPTEASAENSEKIRRVKADKKAVVVQQIEDQESELEAAKAMMGGTPVIAMNNALTGWSDYISKAVSSYLIPTQVSEVLAQDRAFATALLTQPGLKHVCGLRWMQNDLKLLIACEDGFLHVYFLNVERGGQCKLERVHDLRCALDDVIELNLSESMSSAETSTVANISESTSPAVISITTSISSMTSPIARSNNMFIENPKPAPDNSYAGILKGDRTACALTDSAKFRKIRDAIETPMKLYDEQQFPPVAIAAKD